MRLTIAKSTWAEIRTAYASGIGLREIARNMNIPEGTVLARAKREGWTREIQNEKALAECENSALAVTPVEAVAATLAERGQRHLKRMAGCLKRLSITSKQWTAPRYSTPLIESKNSTRLRAARSAFRMMARTPKISPSTSRFWEPKLLPKLQALHD